MVLTIIFLNVALAIFNLHLIEKIYQFNLYLLKINHFFDQLHQHLPLVLKEIPLSILILGRETRELKANYRQILSYQQNMQKLILIIKLSYRLSKIKK
jgi:hypothetical protein